jgi:hypothetical protein
MDSVRRGLETASSYVSQWTVRCSANMSWAKVLNFALGIAAGSTLYWIVLR